MKHSLKVTQLGLILACTSCAADVDPSLSAFAIGIEAFTEGVGAGFGQDHSPEIVLGAPRGFGASMGSTDVLSLGKGGSIVLELGVTLVDGEGDDLIVFENAFYVGGVVTAPYVEPGIVGVSPDGINYTEWPCDPEVAPYAGCAGIHPVFANGSFDASDPEAAGGDPFDLADIGVERARFVRIRDGNVVTGPRAEPPTAGFDLDAVVAVNFQ